jgi:predicted DNA-binding transcriptional regulator YafY
MFSETEARALSLAVAMLSGLTAKGATQQAAQTALEKIRAVLPKATLAQVQALTTILGFYAVGRLPLDLDDAKFVRLQQAIQEQRVVQIRYHALHDNQVTERTVEPLHLAYLDNAWVLTAYCRLRQGQRNFRLDRIDRFTVTTTTFAPRSREPAERTSGEERITVRFDAAVVRWVRESQHFTFSHAEPSAADGSVIMHYRVNSFGQISGWLLSWGAQAEVVAPPALRTQLLQTAIQIAERHRLPIRQE